MLVKKGGEWVSWNWTEYQRDARNTAKGFLACGLDRQCGVGIMAHNCPGAPLGCPNFSNLVMLLGKFESGCAKMTSKTPFHNTEFALSSIGSIFAGGLRDAMA